jgi:succinate dehydrogenase / fumarate reductase, iron-sulfur subunit
MRINVNRYDPDINQKASFDSFDVPAKEDWTVMDVLDYIAEHLDSTIAYYRHSACDHGVCGRCALKVNGKPALACTREVGNDSELTLEPKTGDVVRDLVVSNSNKNSK